MHELGIAQELLNVALDFAKQNNATQITLFSIETSQSADESQAALRQHLETLTRGTIAEGAQFEIIRAPEQFHCLKCGNEYAPDYLGEACPKCGSARVLPIPRAEFKLASIDIE